MNVTGILVLIVAVAATLGFGFYRRATDGNVKAVHKAVDNTHLLARLGVEPPHRTTFIQFSSEFCAPCRATKTLLTRVADEHQVGYVDLDAAEHLDLVQEYGITRTPTVLVLDETGTVRHRAVGAPRKNEILHTLHSLAAPPAA